MKITFLIPPVLDGTYDVDRTSGCNYNSYFLPLLPMLYAATMLEGKVERVKIVDFPAHKKSLREFSAFIETDDSDLYFFYTVFLCQKTDMIAREMIRAKRNNVFFIFSGPQPTSAPEVFLDRPDTFIARGEPEIITRELILTLQSKGELARLPGISYHDGTAARNNPQGVFIADLDILPIPNRRLLDHSPYYNPKLHKTPHTAAMASRGCYGRCWFCVPTSLDYARELECKKHTQHKPPARIHSAKRVIEECREIARLGFKSISFLDDQFLWQEERTLEIFEGLKPLGLEWSCLCRPERITDKVAKGMKESGCVYVDMGSESFDQGVLDAIRKDMKPEDTVRAVEVLKKYGVGIEINVLLGASPVETEATMKKTIRELKRLDVDYVLFSIANPFPGTDFYDAAKKEGWLYYGEYIPVDPAKSSIISYPHLSKKKLEQYVTYAYVSYYLNPRYLWRQLWSVKSPKDFLQKFSTAFKFFRKTFFAK